MLELVCRYEPQICFMDKCGRLLPASPAAPPERLWRPDFGASRPDDGAPPADDSAPVDDTSPAEDSSPPDLLVLLLITV